MSVEELNKKILIVLMGASVIVGALVLGCQFAVWLGML